MPDATIPYTVIRSKRKTMALVLHPDNQLEVRCGLKMPLADIQRFVQEKEPWIRRKMNENSHLIPVQVPLNPDQIAALRRQTRQKAVNVIQRFPGWHPHNWSSGARKDAGGAAAKAASYPSISVQDFCRMICSSTLSSMSYAI
jgi:hypothetical protein